MNPINDYNFSIYLIHISSIEILQLLNNKYPKERDVDSIINNEAGFTDYPTENEFEGNTSELMQRYPVWGTWLIIDELKDIVVGRILLAEPNVYSRSRYLNRSEIYTWIKEEFRGYGIGTIVRQLIYQQILPFVNTIIELPPVRGGPLKGGTANVRCYWKGVYSIVNSHNISNILSLLKSGARISGYNTDHLGFITSYFLFFPEGPFTFEERSHMVSKTTDINLPYMSTLKIIEYQLLHPKTRSTGLNTLKNYITKTFINNI